jgi:rRNA small subunit aminocarboxypropyltransferase
MFSPIFVWRHRKERLSKCSLRGLENNPNFIFRRYPDQSLDAPEDAILLSPEGEPLESTDRPLILVDATWRYAETMARQLPHERRSLPGYVTAYPRRQDEAEGLASIEALYIACLITGRPTEGLLDNYHWAEEFCAKNALR